jgi:hypothetical protein
VLVATRARRHLAEDDERMICSVSFEHFDIVRLALPKNDQPKPSRQPPQE